jgi:hypothetical protein
VPSTTPAPAPDPTVKSYYTRQSAGVWTAGAVFIAVITVGPSLGFHSVLLTSGILLVIILGWFVGYWLLSKNLYFVSPTKAGFKDLFRNREVEFTDVRSAYIRRDVNGDGMTSVDLIFQCVGNTSVSMPLDPMDQSWLNDVKAELAKRGITMTTKASLI